MKMIISLTKFFTLFLAVFILGCGKSGNQTTNSDKQTVQTSASDKSVEIQCSGMTCTGCESTIKSKVKKIEGVKDVMADYNTNVVKASYDPVKTNVEAIKEAITDAGYKVESVK
jgi:copper chaperone CopZ